MMPRLPLFLAFLTVVLTAGPGHAAESEDFANCDDCILESLKGVSSDIAANAIIASCRSEPRADEGGAEPARVTWEVIYMGDDQGWRWKVDSAKAVPLIN